MWHPWGSPLRSTDYKMGSKRLQEVNFKYFTSIICLQMNGHYFLCMALYLFCKNVGNKLYFHQITQNYFSKIKSLQRQMDRKETFLYEKASRQLGPLNYSPQMFLIFCLMKLWSVCMKRKCNKNGRSPCSFLK